MKKSLGVCLGASTVTFVKIARSGDDINLEICERIDHNGDPKHAFLDNFAKYYEPDDSLIITGRKFRKSVNITNISEPEATESAIGYLNRRDKTKRFSAVASLGGETFMVYTLDDDGRINSVITKNQCASGTGEFFLQQIKRMNLTIDETVAISHEAEPYKVSGRCSVFCKSDCTHALNKGVPKAEVAAGLSKMMSEKIEELIHKAPAGKILLIGGITLNDVVMKFVRRKFPDAVIPEEAAYFEALGAAVYGLDHPAAAIEDINDIFAHQQSSFGFLEPLEIHKDKVDFKNIERRAALPYETCILGLDVGSTTTKAVVISKDTSEILASIYLYTNGNPIEASRNCYRELKKQLPDDIIIEGLGVTGSGRQIAGLHALTEGIINEITAHANAAVFFDPEVDTIFEIGGQDAKYTYIINKIPADYAMNEACSAGTGSFIEEAAWESLGIKVTEIESIAMRGQNPPNFSDQCAAFINSDISTALQENIHKDDVIAGLVYSICMNYVNRVKGNRQVGSKIFMQGGVCYNKAIPIAMAALTGKNIIVPPEPGLMGAFGVALGVKEKIELGLIEKSVFILDDLIKREVNYKKPFICLGGKEKCDRKCSINIIEIEGKKYPFGGACNKYYNLRYAGKADASEYDYVARRQKLAFVKYAPETPLPEDAPVVGINASFNTYTLFPLYYNFFTQLGFKVILPDNCDEEGLERETASFCYPAQLSMGLFHNLIEQKPDYYFLPVIYEMHVNNEDYHRLDFNCSCVFVSGEAMYLKQTFKDLVDDKNIISPGLNFASGWHSELKTFLQIAAQLGIKNTDTARRAFEYAVKMQDDFQEELFAMGRSFLEELKRDPEKMAMVLIGRPYNSFTDIANKGIPQKYASRGVYILPYDMFDYRDYPVDDEMYWEGGKKILKSAKIVKENPQLFATYISNFSCGPDSMIISTFRNIMGDKPSLTLELDSHSADAGINTRIDAALDIIANYRKVNAHNKIKVNSEFRPSYIDFENKESIFIDSDGNSVPLTDPSVKVLIPSMGDLASPIFASVFKSIGINAEAYREPDQQILKSGRSSATGKECLPLILLAGTLLDYIENQKNKNERIAYFIIQGAGNCRLGQYPVFIRDMIKKREIRNTAPMILMNEDGFAGLGNDFSSRGIQALIISDIADDIRSGIMAHAYDPDRGVEIFNAEYQNIIDTMANAPDKIYDALAAFAKHIKAEVPARHHISKARYIALLGEIYCRRDGFSHKWLNKELAKKGFIVKDAYIHEWIKYVDYLIDLDLLEPEKSLKKKIERKFRNFFMNQIEHKVKKILSGSGYYKYAETEIKPLLDHSRHLIPLEFKGEPGLTLGTALHGGLEKYCGIINLGPFGCMPTRFSESIAAANTKVSDKVAAKKLNDPHFEMPPVFNGNMNIPFLTMETDGNVFPQVIEARLETFALQCKRAAELMERGGNN